MTLSLAKHADQAARALQAVVHETAHSGNASASVGTRFITLSRQAGVGARELANGLASRLNAADPTGEPWTIWDQELVERVSSEHAIPADLVESVEEASHPWLRECLESLSSRELPSDFAVYRRVAITIRALAQAGRAILVGRGAQFITATIPGGLRVRLVAPLQYRIHRTAERHHLTAEQAAIRLKEIEANRASFYRRYWPDHPLIPETFSLTLNAAILTPAQMVDCLAAIAVPQVREREDFHDASQMSQSGFHRTGIVHGGAA